MLSHSQIKFLQSLQQKKFRKQHGVFIAEGEKIVTELLQSRFNIQGVYALEDWLKQHQSIIPENAGVFEASFKDLERISGLKTPNKVLAVIKTPESPEPDPQGSRFTLVLDRVQDPGNLGTIIRTADWFGIRQIVCSPDTADVFSPKVVQATMGSFLRVVVHYTELVPFLEKTAKKLPVYGALLQGADMYNEPAPEKGILVIGNESAGISPEITTFVEKRVRIHGGRQTDNGNGAESLNASVAAGILMAWLTGNRH